MTNKLQNKSYETDNLWCDTETTGLDQYITLDSGERVHGAAYFDLLEIALLLPEVDEEGIIKLDNVPAFNVGIKLSEQGMERMDPWAKEQHTKSGLLDRLETGEGFDYLASNDAEAEAKIIEWLETNGVKEFNRKTGTGGMLYGNNIGFDMTFLNAKMPDLYKYFHYRKGDVSAVNVFSRTKMWRHLGLKGIDKQLEHTAHNDIIESALELNHYTQQLNNAFGYKAKYEQLLEKYPELTKELGLAGGNI
ncbi:oligoribonuclease [Vibrio sp. 10N.239.312.D08]|uniref:oligoribonuclease n=1 Tax=Vibrio sp. 10N.239.312.D08 TaxID=3229978 RepID=UPI00354BC727